MPYLDFSLFKQCNRKNRMKNIIRIVFCSLYLLSSNKVFAAQKLQTNNSDHSFEIWNDRGEVYYRINAGNDVIVNKSKIGLELVTWNGVTVPENENLHDNIEMVETFISSTQGVENYTLRHGKSKEVCDSYTQWTIPIRNRSNHVRKFDLVVRIFEEAVAFRYVLATDVEMIEEATTIDFNTSDYEPYWLQEWTVRVLDTFWYKGYGTQYPLPGEPKYITIDKHDYEAPYYHKTSLAGINPISYHEGILLDRSGTPLKVDLPARLISQKMVALPVLAKTSSNRPVLFTEAADTGTFWGSLLVVEMDGSKEVFALNRAGSKPDFETSTGTYEDMSTINGSLPWRVLIIGDVNNTSKIVESNVITSLNAPEATLTGGKSFDWVKPFRTIFQRNGYFPAQDDTVAVMKTIADFIKEMEWEGLAWDGSGWYGNEYEILSSEPTNSDELGTFTSDPSKVGEITDYTKKLDLGFMAWFTMEFSGHHIGSDKCAGGFWEGFRQRLSPRVHANLRDTIEAWHKNGVTAIKMDFMNNANTDRKETHEVYTTIAREAAERGMYVLYHGSNLPGGQQRTFPNVLGWESVIGSEHYMYKGNTDMPTLPRGEEPSSAYNCLLPYIKNCVGPLDVTPIAYHTMHGHTDFVHQTTLPIILESGVVSYASHVDVIRANEAYEFLKQLPARWDETRAVSAPSFDELGTYAAIARKNKDMWYVGIINNEPTTNPIEINYDSFTSSSDMYSYIMKRNDKNPYETDILVGEIHPTHRINLKERSGLAIALAPSVEQLPSIPQPSVVYECEDRIVNNGINSTITNSIGDVLVSGLNISTPPFVYDNIYVPNGGVYRLKLHYSRDQHADNNTSTDSTTIEVSVNGGISKRVFLRGMPNGFPVKKCIDLPLNKGNNILSFRVADAESLIYRRAGHKYVKVETGINDGINFDKIEVLDRRVNNPDEMATKWFYECSTQNSINLTIKKSIYNLIDPGYLYTNLRAGKLTDFSVKINGNASLYLRSKTNTQAFVQFNRSEIVWFDGSLQKSITLTDIAEDSYLRIKQCGDGCELYASIDRKNWGIPISTVTVPLGKEYQIGVLSEVYEDISLHEMDLAVDPVDMSPVNILLMKDNN